MTTQEMIDVMQAYADGKEIESKSRGGNTWICIPGLFAPAWDWTNYEYRIKPEPKYVPYDSVTEIDREKWVKSKKAGIVKRIEALDPSDNTVRLDYRWSSLKDLFDEYTYEDNTPCGKQVSE